MTSVRRTALAILVAAAPAIGAQQTLRTIEVGAAAGLAFLPHAMSGQCGSGSGGDGGVELGAAALVRLGHGVVVQGDTRLIRHMDFATGCKPIIPPVDTTFSLALNRDMLATSTLRVGLETPRSWPLFRATAGAGALWGARTLPVGVLGLAWSTRGEHRRFFAELERLQTRDDATELRHAFANGGQESVRAIVVHPVAHLLRFGVAWR